MGGRALRAALVAVLLAVAIADVAARADPRPKVVVLGFDGADARLVEDFMDRGELPELRRLRDEGDYARLRPTNPPQTPVSWSTFATGLDPGTTEIFDFLRRDPDSYLPDFALNSETRRTFCFGTRNGPVLGAVAGFVVLALALGTGRLVRRSGPLLWIGSALAGAAFGLAAGLAAHWYLPAEVPDAVCHRKGRTLWEIADEAGLRTQVIHVPATFPAERTRNGRMLSGLGVPDLRGRVGTPSFYTSDPAFRPGDNEFSLELIPLAARRGRIATRVVGPYNKPFYDYVVDRQASAAQGAAAQRAARRAVRGRLDDAGIPRRLDLPLVLEVTDATCTIRLSGQTATLAPGAWSDWFELDFPVNAVVDTLSPVRGLARFKLLRLEPEVELYLCPLNFHPDCHPVAFSWPPSYSEQLRKRFGLYKTIGWPEDTWSLPSGVGDEFLFLEDMYFTLQKDREILRGLLGDRRDDLYVQIFYFTDRIGHLFWQFIDEGHPLYDPYRAKRFAPEVLKAYKQMDEVVGEARRLAGPEALLLVLSDHGFSSFRRGVNYNTWLVRNGLMSLRGQSESADLEKLFDTRDLFANVDWTRTKAYALGLGAIYVNLEGRERQGIVAPGPEYEALVRTIRDGLQSIVDPKTGERPVSHVWHRDEIYAPGFDPNLIPDLRAGNNLNYRVSWQTTLGGIPPEILEDNRKAWSGDHCSSDPDLIPGILFSSRPMDTRSPAMADVMPSILAYLGLSPPEGLHGRPFLPERGQSRTTTHRSATVTWLGAQGQCRGRSRVMASERDARGGEGTE